MSVKRYVLFLFTIFFVLASCSSDNVSLPQEAISPEFSREQVLDAALNKYSRFATTHLPQNGSPHGVNSDGSMWVQDPGYWTNGFFPGSLWQLAYYSNNSELLSQAHDWTLPLTNDAQRNSHDVGFLINDSFGKGYRVTGNEAYLPVLRTAADKLHSRFNEKVGLTRSWNRPNKFTVIIDNMMNLVLLFEAAEIFNDRRYYDVALTHMLTTSEQFVREDGSAYHVIDFDENTGERIRFDTQQGASVDSSWSRGQAWGIYGFAYAYLFTGDRVALETAGKMANYFLDNLSKDNVPVWDFALAQNVEKDTSASAIAAVGMWLLASALDGEQRDKYESASRMLVDALLNATYIDLDADRDPLLLKVTGHMPANLDVETSLAYGDYYLIEALLLQVGQITTPL